MHHSTSETFQKSLFTGLFLFFAVVLNAQQTKIQDFVIFGGIVNCQTSGKYYQEDDGCLVIIGNKSKITSGAIGSYHLIKTTGSVTIGGDLFSNGKIYLADKNTVDGRIAASNSSGYNGSILKTGYSGNFQGNIDVNGNIYIGGGSKINGKVTQPAGTTYNGPTPKEGNITGTPSLPALPQMPDITKFPKAGYKCFYGSETLKGEHTTK